MPLLKSGAISAAPPSLCKITDDKPYLFYNGEHGNIQPQWEADETTMKTNADTAWAKGNLIAPEMWVHVIPLQGMSQ